MNREWSIKKVIVKTFKFILIINNNGKDNNVTKDFKNLKIYAAFFQQKYPGKKVSKIGKIRFKLSHLLFLKHFTQ